MDHLLIPKNPAHLRIEVPHLRKYAYDKPFDSFLSRRGWEGLDLEKNISSAAELKDLEALLQTWLFFGLLEEIFGKKIRQKDWIRKGRDGEDVLTTVILRSWLKEFFECPKPEPITDSERVQLDASDPQHVNWCLDIAIKQLNTLAVQKSPLIHSGTVLVAVCLVDVLTKSLGTKQDAYRASGSLHLELSQVIQNQMRKDGWCKSDIHRLSHQLDLASLYFASCLDRPEPQVHHNGCSTRWCSKSHIKKGEYKTTHDTANCDGSCKFLDVSSEDLTSILESGALPVIHYDENGSPDTIKLVAATSSTSYIAISHVWAHGLGNQDDNSLPQCQIYRISRLVRQLCHAPGNKVVLFWLDTICFPLNSPKGAELAIIAMRRTYADADRVLVIDRYMESVESKPLLRTECIMRILCSSWTRRLWTLQEGALAKSLFFQFADEAINIEDTAFMFTAEMTYVTTEESLEYLPIFSMVSELWATWKLSNNELPRKVLNYLSGGLRWRATSVAADEGLCLATLAGLDMEKVMQAPENPEARMIKFWSLLPGLSAQAIFWSGSKISHPGFRWAPATFLGQPDAIFQDFANKSLSEDLEENSPPVRTDKGLRFQSAGILLNTWRATLGSKLWVRDQAKNWYCLYRRSHDVPQAAASIDLVPRTDKQVDDDGQEVLAPRSIVLIMKNSLEKSFKGPSAQKAITCVVASIYDVDEDRDIIFTSTEDIAFLIPFGSSDSVRMEDTLVTRLAEQGEMTLGGAYPTENDDDPNVTSKAGESSRSGAGEGQEHRLATDVNSGDDNMEEQGAPSDHILGQSDRVQMAGMLSSNVRVRDEDQRLSIDLDGQHYLLDGVELSDDQTWCLD